MLDRLFGTTTEVMSQAMGGLAKRQKAIAENIANADTPHYKRMEVDFERSLASAASVGSAPNDPFNVELRATEPGHFGVGGPASLADFQVSTHRADESTMRNDGNNVDVDAEMTRLAQTSLNYNALADLMKRKMGQLHSVIRGQ